MPKVRISYLNFSNFINKKPFRISKNWVPTNIFKKVLNEQGLPTNQSYQINIGRNNSNLIRIDISNNKERNAGKERDEIIEDDEKED